MLLLYARAGLEDGVVGRSYKEGVVGLLEMLARLLGRRAWLEDNLEGGRRDRMVGETAARDISSSSDPGEAIELVVDRRDTLALGVVFGLCPPAAARLAAMRACAALI